MSVAEARKPSSERRFGAAAVLAVLLAGALFLSGCVKNPVSGEEELSFMDESQEIALGARYYPETTQSNGGLPADDPALQTYVKHIGRKLAALSHRPKVPWDFNVVNSSDLNAFALPGGKISITRGLIVKLKSEDELAGVLGHEIGHVCARHAAQQYTRQVLFAVGLAGLGLAISDEDWGPAGLAVAGLAGNLIMLSYSRDQERQADELGYLYMTRAGYNPRAMVETFRLFVREAGGEPGAIMALLRTHPLSSERVKAAIRRARHAPPRLRNQPLRVARFNRYLARQHRRAPAYAAMDRGDKALAKKKLGAAAGSYRQAIALFGREGLFHSKLALTYLAGKRNRLALREARLGVKYQPRLFASHYILGLAYQRQGRWLDAYHSHRRAAKLLPSQMVNQYYMGYCAERAGARREAVKRYRLVSRADPKGKLGRAARARLARLGYR